MAKSGQRSVETRNVAGNLGGGGQATSTHPDTRRFDAVSVAPTPQPVPSLADAHARRQKPDNPQQSVPGADAPAAVNMPTNESNASSLQVPVDPAAAVPTKPTYDQGEKD